MGGFDPSEYRPEVLEFVWQPWTIEVKPYPDGGYFARVVELPGCMTEADTAAGVVEALEEARAEWITVALEQGQKIPQPIGASEYSGKIFARASPSLHRLVAEEAARHGVSMSQWISEVLAREVGLHDAIDESRRGLSALRSLLDALDDRGRDVLVEALHDLQSQGEAREAKRANSE